MSILHLADSDVEVRTAQGASKVLKGLLIAFAATTTIALSLAIWYLSQRMEQSGTVSPAKVAAGAPR
jgi:hypothetical protein